MRRAYSLNLPTGSKEEHKFIQESVGKERNWAIDEGLDRYYLISYPVDEEIDFLKMISEFREKFPTDPNAPKPVKKAEVPKEFTQQPSLKSRKSVPVESE